MQCPRCPEGRRIVNVVRLTRYLAIGFGLLRVLCSPCAGQKLSEDAAFRKMVANEETIESLVPKINKLGWAVRNLHLPGHHAAQLFATNATVVDLAGAGKSTIDPALGQNRHDWKIATKET